MFTDLHVIVSLRNNSSQGIKKQGDSGVMFGKRNATYKAGNTIDRDLPYKINNKLRLVTDKQELLLLAEAVNTDW